MASDYAWIITKDHLSDGPHDQWNEKGVVGPWHTKLSDDAVSFSLKSAELARNYERSNTFRMYDDDGELYYTGTLYWDGGEPTEDQTYGPLGDFGMPNAGAVVIRYNGHPEWECG